MKPPRYTLTDLDRATVTEEQANRRVVRQAVAFNRLRADRCQVSSFEDLLPSMIELSQACLLLDRAKKDWMKKALYLRNFG